MIALIVNPRAGRGKAFSELPNVEKFVKKFEIPYEVFITSGPGDATKLSEEIKGSGKFEKILILGGDGTVNEVIQALVGSEIPILPLPLGTGNDFVKFFYPRQKYDTVLERHLLSDRTARIDVGFLESENLKRYFINGMGIGFDSEVLNNMKKIRLLKGDFLYTSAVLLTFLQFKGTNLEVSLDNGEISFAGKFLLFNVGNGQYLGGGFRLFPEASLRDGKLDISIIGSLRPMRFFTNFYKAFKGKHITLPEVTYIKSEIITVKSNVPFNLQLDGELAQNLTSIKVSVRPATLKVVV
ncbi:MAG: diacylglycerol kinase family lipid kinase [bacterium]|nr:diacylglycerol kinase family lipid kinase [bacterium]